MEVSEAMRLKEEAFRGWFYPGVSWSSRWVSKDPKSWGFYSRSKNLSVWGAQGSHGDGLLAGLNEVLSEKESLGSGLVCSERNWYPGLGQCKEHQLLTSKSKLCRSPLYKFRYIFSLCWTPSGLLLYPIIFGTSMERFSYFPGMRKVSPLRTWEYNPHFLQLRWFC